MECSDDEAAEEENFFSLERFLGRGCGGQGQNRWMVFFTPFPGFPFLLEHEVEESINTEGPPSFHPKRIFFQWQRCGEATSRVEILMW